MAYSKAVVLKLFRAKRVPCSSALAATVEPQGDPRITFTLSMVPSSCIFTSNTGRPNTFANSLISGTQVLSSSEHIVRGATTFSLMAFACRRNPVRN